MNDETTQLDTRHFTGTKFQYTRGSLLLKCTLATDLPWSLLACSLISNQFDTREQNSGAKVLLRNIFFTRNRWCRRGSFAPGACCRSVLPEQAPSCVPAFKAWATDRLWGQFLPRWFDHLVEKCSYKEVQF